MSWFLTTSPSTVESVGFQCLALLGEVTSRARKEEQAMDPALGRYTVASLRFHKRMASRVLVW